MAESFTIDCMKCFATIPITDPGLIGKSIACPQCGEAARVRAPAAEDDDGDEALFAISDGPATSAAVSDEPTDTGGGSATDVRHPNDVRNQKARRKKKRKKPVLRSEQDLSGVRTGVFLLFFQAMVWVVLVLNVAGFALATAFGVKLSQTAAAAWLGGIGIVFLLSYVIGVCGKAFCLKAPESVGREFITIALVMEAIAFVMGFLWGTGLVEWEYTQLVANAIGILGSIMYLWFLSDLALHIDREYLSEDALHIVGLGFATFIATFLVRGSLFFLGIFGLFLFAIPMIMTILMIVRYITLIVRLNAELKEK